MRCKSTYWLSISLLVAIVLNTCTDTGVDPENPHEKSIVVTSPRLSGVTWYTNENYTITWDSTNSAGALVAIYLYQDSVCEHLITPATSNDGAFSMVLPFTVVSGDNYRIQIVGVTAKTVFGFSNFIKVINNYDNYEPDNDAEHATLIDTGGTIQYHTLSRKDVDWLKFTATNKRCYHLTVQGKANPRLQIYDQNKTTPLYGYDTLVLDTSFVALWTCTRSGTFFCRITSNLSNTLLPYSARVQAGNALLEIVSPKRGASFTGGNTLPIQWKTSSTPGSHISLYLLRNDTLIDAIGKALFNSGSCIWTIPYQLPGSKGYRIKIMHTADTSIQDCSDTFAISKPPNFLTILKPDSSSRWNSGVAYTVSWNYTGKQDFAVKLALYDSSTYVGTIATGIKKTSRSYSWHIPSSQHTSSRYQVKITNPDDTSINDMSTYFQINHVPSVLTITAPATNAVWETGTENRITWTDSGNVGDSVRLDLYDSALYVETIISGASTSQRGYNWITPVHLPTGIYRLKIISVNDTTLFDFSEQLTIVKIPATIAITSPCSTDVWDVISTYPIRWSSKGLSGSYASLELFHDSTREATIAPKVSLNDTSYTWSLPSSLGGQSPYRVKITGITDSTVYDFSEPFTIVPIPNRLIVVSPVSSTEWNTGGLYTIQWTYTLNPGPNIRIELYDSTALALTIDTSVATSNQTYSWTVPSILDSGNAYRIKISSTTIDSVYDFSDTFTIIYLQAGFSISTPTTGTNWIAGTSHTIQWNSVGNVPGNYVSIHLYDSVTRVATIASNVNRLNGRYTWNIPSTITWSDNYRLKIFSTSDTTVHGYSNFFSINEQPKRLTISTPNAASKWTAGENNSIYWTYSGMPGTHLTIELFDSSVFVQSVATSILISNTTYLWSVPTSLRSGNKYQIKITSVTVDTVNDFSELFSIQNPSIVDVYEPDSVYTLAKMIVKDGLPQSHALSAGDLDWLKFEAVSGTTYTISTGGPIDTYLNLFGADGTTLLDSDDDSGTDLNALITWPCLTTGTCYFRVSGNFKRRAALQAGYYTVTVR